MDVAEKGLVPVSAFGETFKRGGTADKDTYQKELHWCLYLGDCDGRSKAELDNVVGL
jgi:hypothetical protein